MNIFLRIDLSLQDITYIDLLFQPKLSLNLERKEV